MSRHEHLGSAAQDTLSASLASGGTSLTTTNGLVGWPTGATYPFFAVIGRGTPSEEKIECLSRSGGSIVIGARGVDGTVAVAHGAGDAIEHCLTALEIEAMDIHQNATGPAHGRNSALVGVSDVQTLTNKTMSGASNNFSNIPVGAIDSTYGGVVEVAAVQTLTNKTMSGVDNSFSNIPVTAIAPTAGGLVEVDKAQTLTNKTLTAPVLTIPVIASFASAQHDHQSAAGGGVLALTQGQSHGGVDTDLAATSLHHTLGVGANQAAKGDHTHAVSASMRTVWGPQTGLTIPKNTQAYGRAGQTGATGGVVFTAPPSGAVSIYAEGLLQSFATSTDLGFQLNQGGTVGAGAVVSGGADNYALVVNGQDGTNVLAIQAQGPQRLITGLTPGAQYNCFCVYKNIDTVNAVATQNCRVVIIPQPV